MELGRDVWSIVIKKCPNNSLWKVNRFFYRLSWDPEIIRAQVEYFLERDYLPRWLRYTAHRSFSLPLTHGKTILRWTGLRSCLVAGGYVVKELYCYSEYQKSLPSWVSDVDIWGDFSRRERDPDHTGTRRLKTDLSGVTSLDQVEKGSRNFNQIVSNFDLSCCQIGIVLSEKNGKYSEEVITSRLFWYTYYTGKIIVMPLNRMINYRAGVEDDSKLYQKSIALILAEMELHGGRGGAGYEAIRSWTERQRARVEKYINRGVGKNFRYLFIDDTTRVESETGIRTKKSIK